MIVGRKRIASGLAAICITALSGSMLTAPPTYATPNIQDVATRVAQLYHQAEQASERYNQAKDSLEQARSRLTALESDRAAQQAKVEQIRRQVALAIVTQAQGAALSSTAQVVLSKDPDAFLARLTTVAEQNDVQAQMMSSFATQAKRLQLREQATQRELVQISATKKKLGVEKVKIDTSAAEAKRLLSRLRSAQQARVLAAATVSRSAARTQPAGTPPLAGAAATEAPAGDSPGADAPTANVPVSGRAATAVNYALAQVRDAYVYGAAGPNAFDCSGLTMMAWGQAGVGLPHSSGAQMGSGTRVSSSQLQAGDLVFYYSPVSHVGIYIGNGQIVHAANPSTGVQIAPVFSMPYVGAVRPG